MHLTGEQELIIRQKIAEQIDDLDTNLFVVPSPLFFESKAGFFNVLAPKLTQKEIERSLINAVWISYLRFEDDAESGCGLENPEIIIHYRLHLFAEYGFERVNENDSFLTRVLIRERDFMDLLLKIRENFLGENDLVDLPEEIQTATTENIEQSDFSESKSPVDYVAGIEGFTADLVLKARILMSEQ
jgi:hypothetical protein